ncbi:sigma factor-like helix-turn-helix DNA-binding protein [Siminovitchia sp. 179-K 8D1 HS]|uniref:sigma factor-like helix-turn-helix DNA-binding protein n=1 Tax=Siminovitchia sp. 179-K 8D1 HS TaxID=3142385 RepID=UPI00399F54ED
MTELEESKKESNGVLDVIDFLMKTLTPKQAVIVMLKEGFQFQLKEIAMLLDTTEVAVKASLHRARKRMDKREPEKASFSNELYWTNNEQEQFYGLFHKAVELQDPTVLIKAIPSIRTLKKKTGAPIAVLNKNLSYPNSSPSSTLSLAA